LSSNGNLFEELISSAVIYRQENIYKPRTIINNTKAKEEAERTGLKPQEDKAPMSQVEMS
jgi:hypothetical protein